MTYTNGDMSDSSESSDCGDIDVEGSTPRIKVEVQSPPRYYDGSYHHDVMLHDKGESEDMWFKPSFM